MGSLAVINDKPFSTTPRHRRQPRHFSPNPPRWHPVLLSPSCPPMALPAARLTLCQRSSPRLSARISFRPSTPEWPRTRDSHTPSVRRLVTKPLLSPGELVVLLPVFPVSLEEEPTVLDRLLSVTCADLVACSHQPRSGESGTKRSTSDKSDTPLLLPWLLHPSQLSFWPVVIKSEVFAAGAIARTSSAVGLLKSVGASADVAKVKNSRKLRAGKGKLRGRRHRQRRGPLVVYDPEVDGKELSLAFRNISGVETSSVFALNLLQLAPGGHLGRFIIWTSAAFKALDTIYGSTTTPSDLKKDFLLPSPVVQQADIGRLINSSELQSFIRAAIGQARTKRAGVQKKNPLHNKQVLLRLNPYAAGYSKDKIGTKGLDAGKPERAAKTPFAAVLKED